MKLLSLLLSCLISTSLFAAVIFDIDLHYGEQQLIKQITTNDTDEQEVTEGNYSFVVSTRLVNQSVVAVLKAYITKPSGVKKLFAQPTFVIQANEPEELLVNGVITEKDVKLHVHAVYVPEE